MLFELCTADYYKLQNFILQQQLQEMPEGRNIQDTDDGVFVANSCIQLSMYVHVLLYFVPLLHRILHGHGHQLLKHLVRPPLVYRHKPFKCSM